MMEYMKWTDSSDPMITRLYTLTKKIQINKNGQKDKAIHGQEVEVPRFQDSQAYEGCKFVTACC